MQRRHKGVERNLAASEDTVSKYIKRNGKKNLCDHHPCRSQRHTDSLAHAYSWCVGVHAHRMHSRKNIPEKNNCMSGNFRLQYIEWVVLYENRKRKHEYNVCSFEI